MGYTHYYSVTGADTAEWRAVWPKLIEEVPLILEAADVPVCGPTDDNENLIPPIANLDEGIAFNGVADDGHETFYLSREARHHFVKTLRKPYDTAVACILLRAHLLSPNNFRLNSDGTWDQTEWNKTRQLYGELWPGEPVWCPWGEASSNTISSPEKAKEETSSKARNQDNVLITTGTLDSTAEVAEIWKKLESDLLLPSELKSVKSTVSGVDFSCIRNWLSRCEGDVNHNECKASKLLWKNLPGIRFKVIDVYRRCIVDAPSDCSYIVLSYVWGGVTQFKLTADSISFLTLERGLDTVWSKLPTTIRDAIIVCEKLEERYLWIDALCIMQDSVRDMKLQILRMRQIYAAAKCTIVAISANTAAEGLLKSSIANKPLPCTSEGCLNSLLESSPWSSRAWCYQEKVLSHRAVLFTSSGIYMQCQSSTVDVNGTPLTKDKNIMNLDKINAIGGMLLVPFGAELESYISAVEYYSRRKLTKQEDKMKAFQGIFQRYKGTLDGRSSSFCYGLPTTSFDQTFCWRTRQHTPYLRNKAFPSWSWLGWNDAVSFDRKMIQETCTNQIIYFSAFPYPQNSYTKVCELRKPASQNGRYRSKFGFPATAGVQFSNSPEIYLFASVAHLRIAPDPVKSNCSNGLYAVFPTECREEQPVTPSQSMTIGEYLSQPMPEIQWMDAETAAAPSIPATQQTVEEYNPSEHNNHRACLATTPLAYIWLDNEWREKQSKDCIMEFMALAGHKDASREGQWIITMLMCLQRMEKNGQFWAMERLQVMSCEVQEERWLKTGAEIISIILT